MSDKNEEKWNGEKWVEERMKNDEDIRIPEALEPENIERKLLEKQKEIQKKNRWKYTAAATAACLCIVAGIAASSTILDQGTLNPIGNNTSEADSTAATAEEPGGENGAEGDSPADGHGGKEGGIFETEKLASAKDYDEIYEYIEALAEQNEGAGTYSGGADTGTVEESAPAADTAGSVAGNTAAGSAADSSMAKAESYGSTSDNSGAAYSDTNVREEEVGEADIVKTDGENLYIVSGQKIFIVSISGEEMEQESVIEKEGDCYISEVYIEDNSLVVIYTKTEYDDGKTGYDGTYKNYTYTEVYDVSRPEKPERKGSSSQSGYYNTMRVRDGYVYVFSDFYADMIAAGGSAGGYIPEVQGKSIAASDIYIPQYKMGNEYTVITAFALDKPGEKTDSKAVFGTAGMCYVSGENIYITESHYGSGVEGNMTTIRKIAYDNGKLKGVAQTKIGGILNDSFSIDEYEGNLRLVVTETITETKDEGIMQLFGTEDSSTQTEINSLYVLDEELNLLGEINDLAEGESVYSARLMGDTGYFVTFKQVDPLFSVDLSDPEEPKILGELKIPGFSEYLHPYGEGKLLGIGMAVDDEGITTEGVKLSMFDISDPSDVKEMDNYVIEEMYGTDAGYNYKAVFADVEKNLFGFMAYGNGQYYYIFTYDEKDGFQIVLERELGGYGEARGLYAGDKFYLVSGNTVESYTMESFKKADDIVL